jgi:hypothetical protein
LWARKDHRIKAVVDLEHAEISLEMFRAKHHNNDLWGSTAPYTEGTVWQITMVRTKPG